MTATLVERYLAAWNETDADARAKAVALLWTEDGTYTDPMADVAGHEAPEGAAEPLAVGFDVVRLAEDGRIRQVIGFLDKGPA